MFGYGVLANYGRRFLLPFGWLIASGFFFYCCHSKILAGLVPKACPVADKYARHPPDDRPSDPSLPPDDGICKSEPCLECRHAPTAGNIGTPRAGSPEIAFIKRR